MDPAEQWLRANDPDYSLSSQAWKHIGADGEYRAPREELPVGGLQEIALLVDAGARPVGNYAPPSERLCAQCGGTFDPWDAQQRFCGDLCRAAARRDYDRERKRRSRGAQAA